MKMEYIGFMMTATVVMYLALQVRGNGCPRYPPSSCYGPFTIRPSSRKDVRKYKTCSGDAELMEACLKKCMRDFCCRAFGVHNGNCIMANFTTEAYHFVKEVTK